MAKKNGARPKFSLQLRLRAKVLYVAGKTYAEIARETGIPREYIRGHACHNGWSLLRQTPEARQKALEAVTAELKEWNETVATETQSLTVDSFPVVRSAIERGSARDLKDSAMGVKTLYEIARLSSGMEDKNRTDSPNTPNVNLFFFNEPLVKRIAEPIQVVAIEP